jgi:hypothetical protein
MLGLKFRRSIADEVIEAEKPSVAERFAQVLARLRLEYELPADVWAAAEEVLQALMAGERSWVERDEGIRPVLLN